MSLLYFLATGAGYLLLEMGLIQTLTVVLGSPVVALTIVLSVLLLFSGGGGALSARWSLARLRGAALVLVAAVAGLAVLGGAARASLLAASPNASLVVVPPLLALAALLAGVPFPAGLRLLGGDAADRAYAWAGNGVASVLASVLSLPLAMSLGISWLFGSAALCYALVAGVAFLPARSGLRSPKTAPPA
jgi:hypothetical protein